MGNTDDRLQRFEVEGVPLAEKAIEQLLAFEALLLKWNKTYNLTAIRDVEGVRVQHLLDSLSVLPFIGKGRVLDVGSGGGLPGIPLAICRPDLDITLVDAVQKKVSFLQQACIELGLKNVHPVHARVENIKDQTFDMISSRAFAEMKLFVELTRHLLAPGGRWLAMKGQIPNEEIAALPADIAVDAIHHLAVPGLSAERHLLVLKVLEA
jgi:16S rRNA (guanine527-N7)-methyltransferase